MENRTSFAYDLAGRATGETNPRGFITTSVYDAGGRNIAVIDALDQRTTSVFDPAGRRIAEIDPSGFRTTTIYDLRGQTVATENPYTFAGEVSYRSAPEIAVDGELYSAGARLYQPALATWMSEDPKRRRSLYDYADNNPATMVDPTGEQGFFSGARSVIDRTRSLGVRQTRRFVQSMQDAIDCAKATGANVRDVGAKQLDVIDTIARRERLRAPTPPQIVDKLIELARHPCLKLIPGYRRFQKIAGRFSDKMRVAIWTSWNVLKEKGSKALEKTESFIRKQFDQIRPILAEKWERLKAHFAKSNEKARYHLEGIGFNLKLMWDALTEINWSEWWDTIKQTAVELALPLPLVIDNHNKLTKELGSAWKKLWDRRDVSAAGDDLIDAWGHANAILNHLSGWIGLLTLAIPTLIGAILGGMAGGVGAVPGAIAGFKAGYAAFFWEGVALAISNGAQQMTKAYKALLDLGVNILDPAALKAIFEHKDSDFEPGKGLKQVPRAKWDEGVAIADQPAVAGDLDEAELEAQAVKDNERHAAVAGYIAMNVLMLPMVIFGPSVAKFSKKALGVLVKWVGQKTSSSRLVQRLRNWLQRRHRSGGKPPKGEELGRGADGIVYEIPNDPDNVLKEFHHPNLPQARNEFANLENARAIRPNNVVSAQAPANPRQGWIVKERVYPSSERPDNAQLQQVLQDFENIPDAASNLMWGTTTSNRTPRWILIE